MWENIDIKLVTTEIRKNYLVLEPSYHTTKFFTENLFALQMTNKPVYLGLSILELSKIFMYEFWYDYATPKNEKKSKVVLYGYGHFIVSLCT